MQPQPNSKRPAANSTRTLAIATATLLLTGCATAPSNPPGYVPGNPGPRCATVTQFPRSLQTRASAELRSLPPDSALIPLITDLNRMRDEARACRS